MGPEVGEWVYIQRAAALKGVSRRTIYYWVKQRLVRSKEGRCKSRMVLVSDLLAVKVHHHKRASIVGASLSSSPTPTGSVETAAAGPKHYSEGQEAP